MNLQPLRCSRRWINQERTQCALEKQAADSLPSWLYFRTFYVTENKTGSQTRQVYGEAKSDSTQTKQSCDLATHECIKNQTDYRQGSHSLAYKKFQDFSRTFLDPPKTFFQDSVIAQLAAMFKYTDKQQQYLLYTYSMTVESTVKRSSQVAKELFR